MLQLMLLFDAIFEEAEATDVIAIVVTMLHLTHVMTALGNQKTALVNHVGEKIVAMIPLANLVTTIKLTLLEKLIQLKILPMLHFDAILDQTEATDVTATVVMTALANQKTELVNHVNEKAVTMIPLVNHVTTIKLT